MTVIDVSNSWYSNLKHYLSIRSAPSGLDAQRHRALRLKSARYQLVSEALFRRNFDNILLRCLEREKSEKFTSSLHEGPADGHFGAKVTAHKILRAGYYWPTLFKDVYAHVRKYVECQKSAGKEKRLAFLLQPVDVNAPFQQWGLDMIGEINPQSSSQHKYIITATYYFTRWAEAIPLWQINENYVISFLTENIITRFGVFDSIVR